MSSLDWKEVKRLAADFQRAQLCSTLQRLSERNCVELITKLIQLNLLDVIFTADGKEYITPQYLETQIRDELYLHGGRITHVELTKKLNVALFYITKTAIEMEKHDKNVKVILGRQIIDKNYMIQIVAEISDKLNQNGTINIAELTLHYDLPEDFLQTLVERALGKTIHGTQDKLDPRIFYTEGFVATNNAKMRGAFFAVTKPTPLSTIFGQCHVPEQIFFAILDTLHGAIQIPGVISSKQGSNGIYVPAIYSKSQSEWVDNFYKQNGYLEYDALTRLGIQDAKNFVKRHFARENLTLLDSVTVGPPIIDQVDANIEETMASNSFIDIYPLLPSVFSPKDIEKILKDSQKRCKADFQIFATTVIVSNAFLDLLTKSLEHKAEAKAIEAVESGEWFKYISVKKIKSSKYLDFTKNEKKDDRRKKASIGKAGGGSQGRETKTKSTKKKYNPVKIQYDDSDNEGMKINERSELTLLTAEDIRKELDKGGNFSDIHNFVDELTAYLQPKLNKQAVNIAERLAQTTKSNNISEVEEKLNMLISNIRIFEKGIKCIPNKEVQNALSKYLMRTLGVDFVIDMIKFAAQQNVIQCPANLTAEIRQKILLELPNDIREHLTNLHKAAAKGSVEEFLNDVEPTMVACCLVSRKLEKKREKALMLGHKQALLEQLSSTNDPALALHLVTSILFTATTQSALHMSGRHVSPILDFLQAHLEDEVMEKLVKYHDLVLTLLSSDDEEIKAEHQEILRQELHVLKELSNHSKKHVTMDK
ncbi:E3 UFM1-protein ligase 1 homolog [Fopius arisanus]|uniref:E3 UFM1-protein ligase 1 homolog n=2 Tax=Fopius arisanus TaxID=64838 RepID=A0A0C9PQD5_9HYME|nr:PREDICTED: E3 UFM1-protein ligase 1 homolog [Fopius arisanus]